MRHAQIHSARRGGLSINHLPLIGAVPCPNPMPLSSFTWCYWQNGYGAFSIGQSGVEALKKYIARQKEHHRKKTFQDEFRAFLAKYQVEYDERYVWD
jgi:hypothetical protein